MEENRPLPLHSEVAFADFIGACVAWVWQPGNETHVKK